MSPIPMGRFAISTTTGPLKGCLVAAASISSSISNSSHACCRRSSRCCLARRCGAWLPLSNSGPRNSTAARVFGTPVKRWFKLMLNAVQPAERGNLEHSPAVQQALSAKREQKMLRYAIAAASVLAIISGSALAEDGSVTIEKTPYGKSITKHYINHHGKLGTKKRVIHDGMYGSSVTKSRTVTDPAAGESVTTRTTIDR